MDRIIPAIVGGQKNVFVIRDGYHERSEELAELCKKGVHRHNEIEDECCPCFRCCCPRPPDPPKQRCSFCDVRYEGYVRHMLSEGELCQYEIEEKEKTS